MRLTQENRDIIRQTVAEIFGEDAVVSLFGSRLDDKLRGGDIDLLVQSSSVVSERQKKILLLVARLQIRLGDLPIDVLVLDPQTRMQPVYEEALRTGLRL